jgi:hypothetical protein
MNALHATNKALRFPSGLYGCLRSKLLHRNKSNSSSKNLFHFSTIELAWAINNNIARASRRRSEDE